MPKYGSLWPTYKVQWDHMRINDSRQHEFEAIAKRLIAAKDRYKFVEAKTGVPWYMIAVIHERESSQNWYDSLAQGDPWDRVSVHVPRGRGPFSSWEAAAIDALRLQGFENVIDWRLEKILYHLEAYNGWGYSTHATPSAYLWAGTNQYHSGKYIADGVWDESAVDTQAGTAALLSCMMKLDSSISPERETTEGYVEPPTPTPKPAPTPESYNWEDVATAALQLVVTLFGKKNV